MVREPPSPFYSHQRLVTDLTVLLQLHVREHGLGQVCVSPVDVILDEPKALIVQPDVIFVSNDRIGIVRDQIWGAHDLVVEVISPRTAAYDSTQKLDWFRTYGVRECWLVYPRPQQIVVHTFDGRRTRKAAYGTEHTLRSRVLPQLRLEVAGVFA